MNERVMTALIAVLIVCLTTLGPVYFVVITRTLHDKRSQMVRLPAF